MFTSILTHEVAVVGLPCSLAYSKCSVTDPGSLLYTELHASRDEASVIGTCIHNTEDFNTTEIRCNTAHTSWFCIMQGAPLEVLALSNVILGLVQVNI